MSLNIGLSPASQSLDGQTSRIVHPQSVGSASQSTGQSQSLQRPLIAFDAWLLAVGR
jgi:hypothetical protein